MKSAKSSVSSGEGGYLNLKPRGRSAALGTGNEGHYTTTSNRDACILQVYDTIVIKRRWDHNDDNCFSPSGTKATVPATRI